MNKNGEERQVTDFWCSIRGASGPNGEKKNREDAVYCTVVTQIVTSHSRVQDDPTKFSFFLPHRPNVG